ncbi:antitoxin [bacterium CPR1]|nr:antitoxin [bacterium CPR1]
MRTTLDIADDVLLAARELARKEGRTAGQVLSDLARRGLQADPANHAPRETEEFYGFRPLPSRGVVVTNELVSRLREEDPD